ncbi:MAG: T9SS type A sorting domain-containing protein, partial [Bacteroidia bacterium]|nr:T9SS type A sorting domain-containing protein [Bacteroidia bacterium]
QFELIDLSGRTVLPAQSGAVGAGSITLPATQLSPGLYLLKVSAKDGRTALLKLLRTAQ